MMGAMRKADRPSLVAGLALVVLGTVLLLDQLGSISLSLGASAPLTLAVVGAVLLASGLARRA